MFCITRWADGMESGCPSWRPKDMTVEDSMFSSGSIMKPEKQLNWILDYENGAAVISLQWPLEVLQPTPSLLS